MSDPESAGAKCWLESAVRTRPPSPSRRESPYNQRPHNAQHSNVNVCGRVLLSRRRAPSKTIRVLSSLSFRRLPAIQSRTRSRQPAKRSIASWHEAAGTLIYSCVSSAYARPAKSEPRHNVKQPRHVQQRLQRSTPSDVCSCRPRTQPENFLPDFIQDPTSSPTVCYARYGSCAVMASQTLGYMISFVLPSSRS